MEPRRDYKRRAVYLTRSMEVRANPAVLGTFLARADLAPRWYRKDGVGPQYLRPLTMAGWGEYVPGKFAVRWVDQRVTSRPDIGIFQYQWHAPGLLWCRCSFEIYPMDNATHLVWNLEYQIDRRHRWARAFGRDRQLREIPTTMDRSLRRIRALSEWIESRQEHPSYFVRCKVVIPKSPAEFAGARISRRQM